jgi:hypothetical protein
MRYLTDWRFIAGEMTKPDRTCKLQGQPGVVVELVLRTRGERELVLPDVERQTARASVALDGDGPVVLQLGEPPRFDIQNVELGVLPVVHVVRDQAAQGRPCLAVRGGDGREDFDVCIQHLPGCDEVYNLVVVPGEYECLQPLQQRTEGFVEPALPCDCKHGSPSLELVLRPDYNTILSNISQYLRHIINKDDDL